MGVVYIILLSIHLFAIQAGDETLALATKPMLMIALLMLFLERAGKAASRLKFHIFLALVFSLAGDVLLIFQGQHDQFFMFGLAAFLLAHIFYILYFRGIRKPNRAEGSIIKTVASLVAVVYAIGLLWFLFPKLGSMKIPVMVYGATISMMLVSVFFAFVHIRSRFAVFSVAGAILFVVSDSLLAINKFHTPFEASGFLIMLTYGLAQLFIVWGAIRNLKAVSV
jgi:uncharacterized membrane protein YhhN